MLTNEVCEAVDRLRECLDAAKPLSMPVRDFLAAWDDSLSRPARSGGGPRLKEAMERLRKSWRSASIAQPNELVGEVLAAYDAERAVEPSEAAREWRQRMMWAVQHYGACSGSAKAKAWRDDAAPLLDEAVRLMSRPDESAQLRQQKDAAYTERDRLVHALTKVFPSYLCRHDDADKEWDADWRWIVVVDLPTGQASWHIHDSERPWFDLEILENSWDGHTTEEKYQRLFDLPIMSRPDERGLLRELREWAVSKIHPIVLGVPTVSCGGLRDKIDELLARAPEPADGERDGDADLRAEVERLRAENEALRKADKRSDDIKAAESRLQAVISRRTSELHQARKAVRQLAIELADAAGRQS